jgi:RND family efflux transporter MFP subunit
MFSKLNKRVVLIVLSIFILLSAGGFAFYQAIYLPSQATEEQEIQTTRVRQGDLVIYASGSGTLIAADEIQLGFGTNGTIAELNVQVGDTVQAGDVLAVQGDRDQLEAAVAADQLSVMNAQKTLEELYANADLVSAQAELDLANAMDELEDAQYYWQSQQGGNRADNQTIKDAEADLVLAENNLENARSAYEKVSGLPSDDPKRANAYSRYYAALQDYYSALGTLNWYTGHPTEVQQTILDAELNLAEAKLAEAKRLYEQVKDGPDPDDVTMAELQLANAEAQLAVSQQNLEEAIIVAPMEGTILGISAEVGQSVSSPFITLADLSHPYLEIFLDETDLDSIDVGYEVEVIFDAIPDQVLIGTIVQVDPSLYTSNQVSTIKGLVKLDQGVAGILENLLLGMNASVDVIGGRAEGVALVPVEALRELSPGEYAVFVMEHGEPKLRMVEVGLMDFTFAEITSGLEIGEVVTTGIVETQ